MTISKQKYQESNRNLIKALENLEEITAQKIKDAALHSDMLNIGADDSSALKAQVVSQSATIEKINEELNNLQKDNLKLVSENEELTKQNNTLTNKLDKLRKESEAIINEIETDLLKISKIVHKETIHEEKKCH